MRLGFGGNEGVRSSLAIFSLMSSKLKPLTAENTFSSERDGLFTKDIIESLSSFVVSNVCNVENISSWKKSSDGFLLFPKLDVKGLSMLVV